MALSVAVILLFGLCAADKTVSSVEFADSDKGEIEFGKSADVYGGANENDVGGVPAEEAYLRNFKSLHNATDLQALASDVQQDAVAAGAEGAEAAASRADTGPRVLRGAHADLAALPALEHALFTPYKHNKIDTADFSDCALQGEWKPIGVPNNHYGHHEDHQKEHFHSAAEGIEAFPSIAAPNTHSPLDTEGLAFWNQFIKEAHGNPNVLPHHHKKKKHHHREPHPHPHPHHRQPPKSHHIKQHPRPPHVQDLDIFENLRKPVGAEGNGFRIQEKPIYGGNAPLQQSLVLNQPTFSDVEFALLQANANDAVLGPQQNLNHDIHHGPQLGALHGDIQGSPYENHEGTPQSNHQGHHQGNHQGSPQGSLHNSHQSHQGSPHGNHQASHQGAHQASHQGSHQSSHPGSPQNLYQAPQAPHYQDESFLSPPPAPHRFHLHKPPPPERPPQHPPRPKFVHKPHKTQQRIKGPSPHRPPPPVVESEKDHIHSGGFPKQSAAESSTFTCGHNHAEGTNYHTASYQVEGESDPSLLEEDISGLNHLAPIIVGQPAFEHGLDEGLFERDGNHRFPKQHGAPLDLEEEGTETGGSDDEDISKELENLSPFADKLVQQTTLPESSTQSNSLETTAPQTFNNEPKPPSNKSAKQGRPPKAFYDSSKQADTHSPSFDTGFDHSGFVDVNIKNYQPQSHSQLVGSHERYSTKAEAVADFQRFQKANPPGQEHPTSHSESNGFFASQFGPPTGFSETTFHNQGSFIKAPERRPQQNSNQNSFTLSAPTSFTDFSFPPFKPNNKGKYNKASVAVFDHGPAHNKTKTHLNPKKTRPHKHYEVSENSGEMIPLSAFFPPKKMPKQFEMRTPNLAVPKAKRPKSPPPPPKYQSTINFDGSSMGVYQSHPRSKVTKIRLKSKHNRGTSGPPRFSDPDFRRSLTIKSRIN